MLRFISVVAISAVVIAGCSSDNEAAPSAEAPAESVAAQPAATAQPPAAATAQPTTSVTSDFAASDLPLDIAAGARHSCLLRSNGSVWCWGSNEHGQLGNSDVAASSVPLEAEGVADAVAIDAGWEHTCAVHSSGEISCWGDNSQGELGNGEIAQSVAAPVKVAGIEDATAVAAGHWHTCALHATNRVSCWGNNNDGQLGNGESGNPEASSAAPILVEAITDAVAIDVGREHSCAVHRNGEMSCWGDNWRGELGDGRYGHDFDSSLPVRVRDIYNAVSVSAGTANTCALLATGEVSCWGDNELGQVGNGQSIQTSLEPVSPFPSIVPDINDATEISVGETFACAKREAGEISCWGSNSLGQLGSFEAADMSAMPISTLEDVARDGIELVTAGSFHACAVLRDGGVVCWGDNLFGQLGNGQERTYEPKKVKVARLNDAADVSASHNHTCALHETGEVSCWGRRWKGRDGDSATGSAAPWPVKLPGISDAVSVSSGRDASCALLESSVIRCWGFIMGNSFTETSDGEISPVPLPVPLQAPEGASELSGVVASAIHFCGLYIDGAVSCAGDNAYGQLGNGQFNPDFFDWIPRLVVGMDDAVELSLGYDHSCAATATGEVYCWGRNNYGQLGNGELNVTYNSTIPEQVAGVSDAVAVALGTQNISCALHATGEVSCWGQNTLGELGTAASLSQDHSAVPVKIAGIQDAVAVSAGRRHICALLATGEVSCWGSDRFGQLGVDDRPPDGFSATPMKVAGITDAIAISAGSFHNCAVHEVGEITCWGSGTSGQLGDGETMDSTSSYSPVQIIETWL